LATTACSGSVDRDDCNSISFEVYQEHVGPDGNGTATVRLLPRDLNMPGFICVASRLRQDHPRWRQVRVGIFDAADGAERYDFDWESKPKVEGMAADRRYERLRRATYVLNTAGHEEYVLLRLFALQKEKYESRIDLPVKGQPRCRVEIEERCVVAIDYPLHMELDNRPIEGMVTVSGKITKEGTLAGLRADAVNSGSSTDISRLTEAALANLATWRMDPAARETPFTVSYRFVVDRTRRDPIPIIELSSARALTMTRGLTQ
jgi:hypothetical protein